MNSSERTPKKNPSFKVGRYYVMLIDADITIIMNYFQLLIYYISFCMCDGGGYPYGLVDICLVKKYSHDVNEL